MELYKDSTKPIPERVEDLLSRMTLEEKAAQLCGDLPASFIKDGKVSIETLREKVPDGHGRFTQYSMVGIVDPVQIAEISNELQHYFVEETKESEPVAVEEVQPEAQQKSVQAAPETTEEEKETR